MHTYRRREEHAPKTPRELAHSSDPVTTSANGGNQQCCRQLHCRYRSNSGSILILQSRLSVCCPLAIAGGPAVRAAIEARLVVLVSFRAWLTYALLL
jgi:hypothetical protein